MFISNVACYRGYACIWPADSFPNDTVKAAYTTSFRASAHEGWGLLGRLGVGGMKNDTELPNQCLNDIHILFGLGAEYAFTNLFAVRLDLDLYEKDAQFVSINLLRRFD